MEKWKKQNMIAFFVTLAVLILLTILVFIIVNANKTRPSSALECDHNFEEVKRSEPGEFEPGQVIYRCSDCGEEKNERILANGKLPQIYFDGETYGIKKDSPVIVKAEYVDEDTHFSTYASIKYQGHTAIVYDKKNYTVKFFKDKNLEEKNKLSLHGWKKSHKYCLKANYIDFSQARNIVSANIWSDVVGSRETIDKNIAELQYYGAIDGYPVMVFLNNEYQGVYTMNIPKDDDTYNIADDKNEAMFVINSTNSDSSYFKANLSEGDKKSVYDLEYCYGENEGNTEWAYESLDRLISFVIQNDGEEFKSGIGQYLDVDSAIDYLITAYYLGLTDNFAKNAILLTYDGQKWIFSLYDLDTAFGLAFDATKFFGPEELLPVKNQDGTISSSTGSLLWDKLLINFRERLSNRYFELRGTILDNEKIIARYRNFMDQIPKEYYEEDLKIWGDIPLHEENTIEQMSSYLSIHSKLLDDFFNDYKGD